MVYLIGNLIGSMLLSFIVVLIVMALINRFNFESALKAMKRNSDYWYIRVVLSRCKARRVSKVVWSPRR